MQKKREFFKKNGVPLLVSILLPMFIMAIAYWMKGIYFGSKITMLASDSFVQYSNFHASFNNVLHGKQNVFYTWYGSLGLNYWAFSAYYLNGIFTPLVGLFNNQSMPDALYVITLVKFGAIGGSFWFFANETFKQNKWLNVTLSICYALMSFGTAYSEVVMWLDGLFYLPLVILGIHRVMDKRKPAVLFCSYLFLFLSNFYMAFMIGVFSFLYFIVKVCVNPSQYLKSIPMYLIVSFLAGGASMVVILPTILDLANNGESLNQLNMLWTPDTGPWDLVVKNMVGVYDTSRYKSAPFIYIGLFPLIFFLFYFVTKKVKLREKLLYGSLIVVLVLSVYVNSLNLFWHGFHAPNMFLFRFSYLISFVIILLAGYALEKLEREDVNQVINCILFLLGFFLIVVFVANKKRYNYITNVSLISTVTFLIIYMIAIIVFQKKWKYQKVLPLIILISVSIELGINTNELLDGIKTEWGYPGRKWYSDPYPDIEKLVDKTKAENNNLYRMENLDPVTLDDSFNYGYSGVSMFSSIRNRHSSAYLNNLGFRSLGSNLTIKYANNTLLMDAILGIKYNISKNDLNKFGFKKTAKSGEYQLYENTYSLPLGMITDKGILKKYAVPSQMELFNYLAGEDSKLFSFGEVKQTSSENVAIERNNDEVVFSEIEPAKGKMVTYEVRVPAKKQAYLSIYPSDMSYMHKSTIDVKIGNVHRSNGISDTGQYYDLGYHEEETVVPVELTFSGTPTVKLAKPDAVFLDTVLFEKSVKKIREKGVNLQTSGRIAKGTVDLEEESVIFTTIPYDGGWQAYIDGKKVAIPTFKKAFLTLSVPKGKHTIEFKFLPQGFLVGVILFIGCNLLFIFYLVFLKRKTKGIETSLDKEE